MYKHCDCGHPHYKHTGRMKCTVEGCDCKLCNCPNCEDDDWDKQCLYDDIIYDDNEED